MSTEHEPGDQESHEEISSIVNEETLSTVPTTVGSLWEAKGSPEKIHEVIKGYERTTRDLATLELSIVTKTINNPYVSLGELKQVLLEEGRQIQGFSSLQDKAIKLLEKFYNRHDTARGILAECMNDSTETYHYVFGRYPKGNVDVELGPSVLYFKCHNLADYASLYTHSNNTDRSVTSEAMQLADKSMGFKFNRRTVAGLWGGIIVENSHYADALPPAEGASESFETYTHELSHALLDLINHFDFSYNIIDKFKNASTLKELSYWAHRQVEEIRIINIDRHAADEILAYCVSGGDKITTQRFLTKKGGLYDYYHENKEFYDAEAQYSVLSQLPDNTKFNTDAVSSIVKDETYKVFVTDYKKLIGVGIDSFYKLVGYGFSLEEARSILAREDLIRWERVVDRFSLVNKNKGKLIHGSEEEDLGYNKIEDFLGKNPHKIKGGNPSEWRVKNLGGAGAPTEPEYDIDYDPSLLVSRSEGMEDLKGSFEIALRKCMERFK